jgi:hypothetical protein
MAAGLRATAKAVEHPPEPKVGAPVLDPTSATNPGPSVSGKSLPLLTITSVGFLAR